MNLGKNSQKMSNFGQIISLKPTMQESKFIRFKKLLTVKIMFLFRYRDRPVTSPVPGFSNAVPLRSDVATSFFKPMQKLSLFIIVLFVCFYLFVK